MALFIVLGAVPLVVFLAIGYADRRWPARLNRRGSRMIGGGMDPFRDPEPSSRRQPFLATTVAEAGPPSLPGGRRVRLARH